MRKWVRVIIFGVLAFLVVLTFVSRTVYHRGLPQVSVVTASRGRVPLVERQETTFPPRADWPVLDRLARGTAVAAGDYVIWHDLRRFDLTRREMELEIRQLEAAAMGILDDYAIELNAYALTLARERLALWLEQAPPYAITAPHGGRVEYVWNAASGQAAFAIINEVRDEGVIFDYVLPRDAIFHVMQSTVVYVVRQRRGVLGMEDYVTAVSVNIVQENDTHVAVVPRDEGTNLTDAVLARAIDGVVTSGSVVWVRER